MWQADGFAKKLRKWRTAVRGCRSAPALAVQMVALSDAMLEQDAAGRQLIHSWWCKHSSRFQTWCAEASADTVTASELGALLDQLVASRVSEEERELCRKFFE